MAKLDTRDYSYFQILLKINRLILSELEYGSLVKEIVEVIFQELDAAQLGYAFVVLLLPDYQQNVIKRVAISPTRQAEELVKMSPIPYFEAVVNPLGKESSNLCVKVFNEQKNQSTSTWADLLSPTVDKYAAEKLQARVGVKTVLVYPLVFRGKTIGLLNFNLTKGEEGVGSHERILLEGITDAAAVALQNSYSYTKLKELDKLKDEFLSLAAHELRTPMTAIKGYSWQLANSTKSGVKNDWEKTCIDRIYKSTDRLVNLVNDMLDVARIESGRIKLVPEKVNISDVVNEVFELLRPQSDGKALVLKNDSDKSIILSLDKGKLAQIFINIVGNAIKFTDKGSITVTTELQREGENHNVVVKFVDTGSGMDKEDLEGLFKKFGRGKSSGSAPGTGLGLYLSRALAQAMGGDIQAFSDGPGKGSTFCVIFKI